MSPRATDVLARFVLLVGAVASVATSCERQMCDDDEECQTRCGRGLVRAAEGDQEAAAAPLPALTAISCQLAAGEYGDDFVSERPHCECQDASGPGYDLWGDDRRCLVVARNARCLLDADDLPRELCVPGDAASCAGLCADLEQRLAADATAQVNRSLAAATCGYWCTCVIEVDGACFRRDEWSGDALHPSEEVPCP